MSIVFKLFLRKNQPELIQLAVIGKLKESNTQKEVGNKIGWSRSLVARYKKLLDNIVTDVLCLAKEHQKDRVTKNVTTVPTHL